MEILSTTYRTAEKFGKICLCKKESNLIRFVRDHTRMLQKL